MYGWKTLGFPYPHMNASVLEKSAPVEDTRRQKTRGDMKTETERGEGGMRSKILKPGRHASLLLPVARLVSRCFRQLFSLRQQHSPNTCTIRAIYFATRSNKRTRSVQAVRCIYAGSSVQLKGSRRNFSRQSARIAIRLDSGSHKYPTLTGVSGS